MSSIPQWIANWQLTDKLGAGYSGAIYRARNIHTGLVVALKVQHVDHECPTNRYERHFYPSLQGGLGMPTLWAAGVDGIWDYLAIDLLGPSLDSLYRTSGNSLMDLRSVCAIAIQLISRLEFMHSRGILHRDIQLGNCVIGLPPNDKIIYMIDFGFSKRYIDQYTHRHIQDSKAKRDFIGNYWFSSVGVHCRGKVPSRRDDLEAAGLMLIHLLTPNGLPWTRAGVPKTDTAHERIKRMKRTARPEELCRGMPPQFEEFLRYCRRLQFAEQPDYAMCTDLFCQVADERNLGSCEEFIWPPPPLPRAEVFRSPTKTPRRTPSQRDRLEGIIRELGTLALDNRPVLGARTNVVDAQLAQTQPEPAPDSKPKPEPKAIAKPNPRSTSIITISSSSSTSSIPPRPKPKPKNKPTFQTQPKQPTIHQHSFPLPSASLPKSAALAALTDTLPTLTSNAHLSTLINHFTLILRGGTSTIDDQHDNANNANAKKPSTSSYFTKEAFAFLDKLVQVLDDPDVWVVGENEGLIGAGGNGKGREASTEGSRGARRTRSSDSQPASHTRSHPPSQTTAKHRPANQHQLDLEALDKLHHQTKLTRLSLLARLRRDVSTATSNSVLAGMVRDFAEATRRSTGRTVTKDGFAFLQGLADQLRVLG